MAYKKITDFLGLWTSAINTAIEGETLPQTDPRISSDPNAEYLVSYLPFDKSVSEDLCGNIWEVSGNPTISDGSFVNNSDNKGALKLPSFTLGGQDFTIGFWAKMEVNSSVWLKPFELVSDHFAQAYIQRWGDGNSYCFSLRTTANNSRNTPFFDYNGGWYYFEFDYTQSDSLLRTFYNGQYCLSVQGNIFRQNFRIGLGDPGLIGCIDEFKIYDGIALHTADFTPPTRA